MSHAPNFSTIRRGPVPATAFCPACGRNLADCQCSGEAVCEDCRTPAGRHHFGCFRCEPVASAIERRLATDRVTNFNAALRFELQQTGGGL